MIKKVLVLVGAPGSGKGTIKKKIMQIWDVEGKLYSNIETSEILRQNTKFKKL